jgi:uncharacterized protein YqfB (UPF0267 family)
MGLDVIFNSNGTVTVRDSNNNTFILGKLHNGIFQTGRHLFNIETSSNSNYILSSIVNTNRRLNYLQLLHQRFAHIYDIYIDAILKNKLVSGINYKKVKSRRYKSPFCESCILSKAIRVSSSKTPGSEHNLHTEEFSMDGSDDVSENLSDDSESRYRRNFRVSVLWKRRT